MTDHDQLITARQPTVAPRGTRGRTLQPTLHQLELLASYAKTGSKQTSATEFGIAPVTFQHELHRLMRRLDARGPIDAFKKLGWLTVPDRLEIPAPTAATLPSSRQLEVLATYVRAGSARATAAQLGVAESTVKNLLANLNRRLRVGTAVQTCLALGWLAIPDGLDATDGSHVGQDVDLAVLAAYAHAGSVAGAASGLGVSAGLVKTRLKASYRALKVHRALAAYQALGWLRPPEGTGQ
jgi:DNA-binding CsgD family transcriptional regulator